jgi:signal transduction histidine kinase
LRTPEADLQAKGDRPYFQATIALPEGSLYLSKIELNQELGRIEIPHRPTVRIATPVDGPGGVPFGIVIVNADAGSMLSGSGRHLGDGRRLFLTNAEGDYLVHPDEAMTFGFDLGHSHRLQGDHPELAGLFTADGDPSFTGLVTTPAGQDLASARRVHIDPADPTRYLVLAALTDDAPLLAGIAARGRSIAVVAIALIVGGTFVAILLTGMITRPLHQVTRAAASLAAGNRDVDLSDLSRRADETGDLARAFTEMARQIVNRENELIEKAEELQHSNTELAQFAYVASHDLQEPLRMVGSYLTLLRQRHAGKLDAEADEFIGYAVDGAARMKLLINDLLNYSRVSNRPMNVEAVDTDAVVTGVIDTLAVRIEETGAEVIHESLPTVHGDAIQLERLFARLIENAMKYRSEAPPRIRVAAEPQGECWLFSVADNGIGIDPRFRDKVFDIFKRLHGREQYPGTGIGLAVCKMVVERHGGKIWVEPAAGGGSVFKFTLPAIVERKGVA